MTLSEQPEETTKPNLIRHFCASPKSTFLAVLPIETSPTQGFTVKRSGGCYSLLKASLCAKRVLSAHKPQERASMGTVSIIGFVLAKNVFQVPGAAADASVRCRKSQSRSTKFDTSRD